MNPPPDEDPPQAAQPLPPGLDFAAQRGRMVREQIEDRGIHDPAVLRAMGEVPREWFVPAVHRHLAYEDSPLPIAKRQTISQPYVVGYMIARLELTPADKVLEIGTGSGYAAAVLSRIVAEVYTVERHRTLAGYARERLATGGYDNVFVRQGDGTKGWPEHAPYDGIIVAAGGPYIPKALQDQLAVGGHLIIPVGRSRTNQNLVLLTRTGDDDYDECLLSPVAFVPLVGDEGW